MLFCKKCGSILKPCDSKKGKVMKCVKCNFISEEKNVKLTEKVKSLKIEVMEKMPETAAKTEETCPKCGHHEAYYTTRQMRGADEPETKFFKCCKCEHIWKDQL